MWMEFMHQQTHRQLLQIHLQIQIQTKRSRGRWKAKGKAGERGGGGEANGGGGSFWSLGPFTASFEGKSGKGSTIVGRKLRIIET